ncbi:hypothetical protein BSKO_03003 [Bryopsis sp. KO-2023]|nr:hypothetical protein BSKO_03003 [Bryopsis sp. KO-2023]
MVLGFLLGSAAIALPQHQVPLFAGYLTVKAFNALKHGRNQSGGSDEAEGAIHLSWTDLCLELKRKDGSIQKILDGVSGRAVPGRLVAIMGPSGAGKTSLLSALARQVPYSKKLTFKGSLDVNGKPHHQIKDVPQAYVQQDDLFYSMLTVRETLTMAAHLRLPKEVSDDQKDAFVEELIKKLGMTQSADTPVGDSKNRGLSGGEKKRLSIGCELVGSPALMFVDEPTSGLDSFQALRVVETMKNLANEGRTVICSIHQPRSSVFSLFDDLVLLASGKVVYSGPTNKVLSYFEGHGHHCPEHYNPADFLADLISIDTSSSEAEATSVERVATLVSAWKDADKSRFEVVPSMGGNGDMVGKGLGRNGHPPFHRQFKLLLKRSWRQATRDKAAIKARLGVNLNSAIIFGLMYFRLKLTSATVQDRLGLLQVSAINTAMASVTKMLNVFPPERTIVTRERAKNSYGVFPYFLAKLIAEVPIGALFPAAFGAIVYPMCGLNKDPRRFAKFMAILVVESFASAGVGLSVGGLAPNTNVAVTLGPAVMLLFIVFGGYYINPESTPKPLRWLPKASLIQWGFQGLVVNEFKGVEFEEDPKSTRGTMKNGDAVLNWLGYDGLTVKKSILANGRVVLFNYWLTYNILRAKKPKFQELEPVAQD